MPLKNQWVNEEVKKKIKKYLETNDNADRPTKIYGMPQKQRKIHSNAGLPQEKEEKSHIVNLTHT